MQSMRRPSVSPAPSADEYDMSIIDDIMWHVRTRMQREPVYCGDLRVAALDLLHEIWPTRSGEPADDYVAMVTNDIDRIPVELLNDLSAKISRVAMKAQDTDPAISDVSSLLAGWLKARAIELEGEESWRKAAYQLKADHALLFSRLLCQRLAMAS